MRPPEPTGAPTAGEVIVAVRDAAAQLQAFVSGKLEEDPAVTVAGILVAGFVLGGGLVSPIGVRLVRAAASNVTTVLAMEILRRALKAGGDLAGAPGPCVQ